MILPTFIILFYRENKMLRHSWYCWTKIRTFLDPSPTSLTYSSVYQTILQIWFQDTILPCYGTTPYKSSGDAKFTLVNYEFSGKPMNYFSRIFWKFKLRSDLKYLKILKGNIHNSPGKQTFDWRKFGSSWILIWRFCTFRHGSVSPQLILQLPVWTLFNGEICEGTQWE